MDFFEQQKRNNRKTLLLIVIFIFLLAAVGYAVDALYIGAPVPYATLIAVVVATANSAFSFYKGDSLVLFSLGAKRVDEAAATDLKTKQLINVVKEMSIAAGIPMPKVYIMQEDSPNAFATGRDADHASVCVTTGLLDTMTREELQGVIAHEIAHIRNKDILTMTIVSALLGAIVLISDMARRVLFYGGGRRSRDSRGRGSSGGIVVLILFVLAIIAPIIAKLMALAVSRSREYMADAGSVEFTRNPQALASALTKIANHYDKVVDKATDGTAHLFISDPKSSALSSKEGKLAELFSTHPPIRKRIEALRAMGASIGA
ncbi:MAG TPA: hypothetical protein ENF73_01585 [Proteobacteria bacterium]|nr:hypothetical protein [Pseudomonadota bacterium]